MPAPGRPIRAAEARGRRGAAIRRRQLAAVPPAAGHVGHAVASGRPSYQRLAKGRAAQRERSGVKATSGIGVRPIDPGGRVVPAVGVVVAALRAAEFVAGAQHGRALRQQQRAGQQGAHHAARAALTASSLGLRRRNWPSGCGRARRGCSRRWPRCACGVAHRVGDREAVVRDHEIDRLGRRALARLEDVRTNPSGAARTRRACRGPRPRTAHRIAEAVVPFQPAPGSAPSW